MKTLSLTQRLRDYAQEQHIDLLGVTSAVDVKCRPFPDQSASWHRPCEESLVAPDTYSPRILLPQANAVIITGMYMYGLDKIESSEPGKPRGKIGPWTRGYVEASDYSTGHVVKFLQSEGFEAQVTNALPFRTLAVRCGLGKIGNNGFFYTKATGSYVRLGCVLTNAPLEVEVHSTEQGNNCGDCRICHKACPTGALSANGYDVALCLHLWQQGSGIHGTQIPPGERHKCRNYLMRTGYCLEVCPRNKGLRKRDFFPFAVEDKPDSPELIPLVIATEQEYKQYLPYHVYKYGVEHIRRDAIIALGNLADKAAIPSLIQGLAELPPPARGLCAWALGKMQSPEALAALAAARKSESDMQTQQEIDLALTAFTRQ